MILQYLYSAQKSEDAVSLTPDAGDYTTLCARSMLPIATPLPAFRK